jgi:hypothetical protein
MYTICRGIDNIEKLEYIERKEAKTKYIYIIE